jgi:hypothetical protein
LRASFFLTQTTLPRSSPGLSDKPCHAPPRKSSCLPSITARGLSREPKDTYKLSNLGDLVRCALARPDGRDLEDHHHDGAVLWRISDRGCTARTAAITSFAFVISGATDLIHAEPQALYKVLLLRAALARPVDQGVKRGKEDSRRDLEPSSHAVETSAIVDASWLRA